MSLVFSAVLILNVQAETNFANSFNPKTSMEEKMTGEQIFIKNADKCLQIIEKAARKLEITGVAMIAYIPGDATEMWTSKMKVVGRLANDKLNFLAIAYAKASEMAVTLKDSGNSERGEITGEFGWQGGVIIKVDSGYLLGAFSGGSSQQDADVAKEGIDWLSKKY